MQAYLKSSVASIAYACLLLALAALPFEPVVGLAVGPITLTPVELLIGSSISLWVVLLVLERRRPYVPGPIGVAAVVLLALLLLAAIFALEARIEALKVGLRQVQGALLAWCVADNLFRQPARAGWFGTALLVGATLSAMLGLWEMSETPQALAATAFFKESGSYMGGLLRLSGSFSYANTAAMYYEALLALAILTATQNPRHMAALGALLVLPPAILLTYSRAALVVTLLILVGTPLFAVRLRGSRAGWQTARFSGLALSLLLVLVLTNPLVRLRFSEPDIARWYGATYTPTALATMAPNEVRTVPILLQNTGRIAWEPNSTRPVRLSYHWLAADDRRVIQFEGRRSHLPGTVAPGATSTIAATVQAPPEPGQYVLAWDMLREYIGRGWFSQMGIAPAEVLVQVIGPPMSLPADSVTDPPAVPRVLAVQPAPPGRQVLWATALDLWSERLWLGLGPDVFRHVYGPRLGLSTWDDRVHTNNLYLELLVGAGPMGLLAFLVLCALSIRRGLQARLTQGVQQVLLGGALIGIAAFLVHGLLDVFMTFTPTYALFWTLIGIVSGLAGYGFTTE